jgi:hypothetical protein
MKGRRSNEWVVRDRVIWRSGDRAIWKSDHLEIGSSNHRTLNLEPETQILTLHSKGELQMTNGEKIGAGLVALGVVGLSAAALARVFWGCLVPGDLPAVSMFLLLIGLVFWFPDLVKDGGGGNSSMRVAVLMIVSLFLILTLKAGWEATKLDELKIDPSWAWVLGVAFGAKMGQSFAEALGAKKKTAPHHKLPEQRDSKHHAAETKSGTLNPKHGT